jgi:sterol desaturase/sphingolipid hydroxylase (fatty acid hydroxylase superfamily)
VTRARKLLVLNAVILVASLALWAAAAIFGWLNSVEFVSHVSMLALVFTAISGIAAGDAAVESESI